MLNVPGSVFPTEKESNKTPKCPKPVNSQSSVTEHTPGELLSDYITQLSSLISNQRGQRREAGGRRRENGVGNGCLSKRLKIISKNAAAVFFFQQFRCVGVHASAPGGRILRHVGSGGEKSQNQGRIILCDMTFSSCQAWCSLIGRCGGQLHVSAWGLNVKPPQQPSPHAEACVSWARRHVFR